VSTLVFNGIPTCSDRLLSNRFGHDNEANHSTLLLFIFVSSRLIGAKAAATKKVLISFILSRQPPTTGQIKEGWTASELLTSKKKKKTFCAIFLAKKRQRGGGSGELLATKLF
jgi:hypothetical protein